MAPGPLQMPHSSYAPTQSSTSSQMPSASSSATHAPPHSPSASSGCRRSRSLLLGCQNIRTRRWRQDRCRCRTRRTHPRSRRHRRRCHRHRRPPRSHHHTRQGVELVAVAVAVSPGCQSIRTRRWLQDRCRCRTRRTHPRSRRHRRRCHRRQRRRAVTTPHTQGVELVAVAVAVSFWDVRTSALVDGARTVADAALVVRAHAVVDVVADAIGVGVELGAVTLHTRPRRRAGCRRSRNLLTRMSEHPHS